jgi:hypothetical protein
MTRTECVFKRNVRFGVQAEGRAVGQAQDRQETQVGPAHRRRRRLRRDKSQMGGARLRH